MIGPENLYHFVLFKIRGGYTKVQIDETAEKAKEMMNIMQAYRSFASPQQIRSK